MTRGRFIAACGAPLLAAAVPGAARAALQLAAAPSRLYVSRPDLNPPPVTVTMPAAGTAPGLILLAPFDITAAGKSGSSIPAGESHVGPLIVDNRGEPVWFLPREDVTAMGPSVQRYKGVPSLTWYEGTVLGPYGGDFVVYDETYRRRARITAGHGLHGDLHEFLLTDRGTALITIYDEVVADLSSVGGPVNGRLVAGIVQEIDLETRRVVFEWRSVDHVDLAESSQLQTTAAGNVDYFHLNAIDVDSDGSLLISSRHTSTVFKVDRKSGDVIWRLGGSRSDFTFDDDATFAYQHDARRQPDGTLTLFDNAAVAPGPDVASRGVQLALDMSTRHVSLVREFRAPTPRAGWAMGNLQMLPDGGAFVCWGTDGSFSEFAPDGELRFDARFGDGSVTYRAFRVSWFGKPKADPDVTALRRGDKVTVYASWNGATGIRHWRFRAGPTVDSMQPVGAVTRSGFETSHTLTLKGRSFVAADAVDTHGAVVRRSAAVRI